MSPGPMRLIPALSSPRSTNCFTNVFACAEGINAKIACGAASCARCKNGAKSRVLQRHADVLGDGATGGKIAVLECRFGFLTGSEIAYQRHDLVDAAPNRPI